MSKLYIYHGSDHIVGLPEYGLGKPYNDYGLGFYCTETIELAKEWACYEKGKDGYANAYFIETDGLNILNLSDDNYNILNWLAILLKNRHVNTSLPAAKQAKEYIITNFDIDISKYDIIIGYRADDSYFSFVRDFVNNAISVEQLSNAMRLGKLGEQVVLKSEKAFKKVEYLENKTEFADSNIYFPKREKRNIDAQTQYLDTDRSVIDDDGIFVRDIIRKKITNENIKLYI